MFKRQSWNNILEKRLELLVKRLVRLCMSWHCDANNLNCFSVQQPNLAFPLALQISFRSSKISNFFLREQTGFISRFAHCFVAFQMSHITDQYIFNKKCCIIRYKYYQMTHKNTEKFSVRSNLKMQNWNNDLIWLVDPHDPSWNTLICFDFTHRSLQIKDSKHKQTEPKISTFKYFMCMKMNQNVLLSFFKKIVTFWSKIALKLNWR